MGGTDEFKNCYKRKRKFDDRKAGEMDVVGFYMLGVLNKADRHAYDQNAPKGADGVFVWLEYWLFRFAFPIHLQTGREFVSITCARS